MSIWYYSDAGKKQSGPLTSEDLVELYRSGRIGLDTLAWREGQAQWQPLADFAAELGLAPVAGGALPPPLPPTPAPAYATQAAQAPPRSGLSGCMIALIVLAVVAIPMIAILAAIALPAYQDYTLRAKAAGTMAVATPLKIAVAEHLTQHSTCPGNDSPGFDAPESYAAGNVASATIGEFESNRCGIELKLRGTGSDKLDGKAVWFEYDPSDSSWQCSSEIDDRYLPANCRE